MGVLVSSGLALTLSQDDEGARETALQWLQVVDAGNYKDAALMLSEEIRGERDWSSYLSADRTRLGRIIKREIVEIKHRSTIPEAAEIRSYEIIRFKTSFQRKPFAIEEVVTARMSCCWEVFGYEIRDK